MIDGGVGDDHLNNDGVGGVVIGSRGNDELIGGSGRDILIGGVGADRLVGNGADDILMVAAQPTTPAPTTTRVTG